MAPTKPKITPQPTPTVNAQPASDYRFTGNNLASASGLTALFPVPMGVG